MKFREQNKALVLFYVIIFAKSESREREELVGDLESLYIDIHIHTITLEIERTQRPHDVFFQHSSIVFCLPFSQENMKSVFDSFYVPFSYYGSSYFVTDVEAPKVNSVLGGPGVLPRSRRGPEQQRRHPMEVARRSSISGGRWSLDTRPTTRDPTSRGCAGTTTAQIQPASAYSTHKAGAFPEIDASCSGDHIDGQSA